MHWTMKAQHYQGACILSQHWPHMTKPMQHIPTSLRDAPAQHRLSTGPLAYCSAQHCSKPHQRAHISLPHHFVSGTDELLTAQCHCSDKRTLEPSRSVVETVQQICCGQQQQHHSINNDNTWSTSLALVHLVAAADLMHHTATSP